jgi:hypothetical protein
MWLREASHTAAVSADELNDCPLRELRSHRPYRTEVERARAMCSGPTVVDHRGADKETSVFSRRSN